MIETELDIHKVAAYTPATSMSHLPCFPTTYELRADLKVKIITVRNHRAISPAHVAICL